MIVHKFGGTSLADADRLRAAARLVRESGGRAVVVVSALAGVTDRLRQLCALASEGTEPGVTGALEAVRARHEEMAEALLHESPEQRDSLVARISAIIERVREVCLKAGGASGMKEGGTGEAARLTDAVLAAGEDLSVELMTAALRREGLAACVIDSRSLVRTDARFGRAVPRDEETACLIREILQPVVAEGSVPVLQGFVGATEEGVTTTLGRGGSDFTAAIVGAALGADEVCIWTDVDGVLSGDPREVREARILPELGYEEAVELAYFGARVIHPAAAKHAAARDVVLSVRNSLRPQSAGTRVRHDRRRAVGVAAVAYKPSVALIKVRSRPMFMAYGFLARVFDVLARHELPVDLVATSHTSTAFTLDEKEDDVMVLDVVAEELARFAEVEVARELATVSVIGHGLLTRPGLAARVFAALDETPVHLISQASDVCLSFLVAAEVAPAVVRRVHSALIVDSGAEVRFL